MTPLTVLYAVAALMTIFLILFAMVGDTLHWSGPRRWQYAFALALAFTAWLASAWLR